MLERIKGYGKSEQVREFVNTATEMVKRYGWEEMMVTPWGYAEKVTKVINDISDYDKCTEMSKETLVQLANGLVKILNHWESRELEPRVKVRIITGEHIGEVKEFCESTANDLISFGMVELI